MKTFWIVKGRVTDTAAHGNKASVGDVEWQLSDGPPDNRTYSADYLSLEQLLKNHAPAIFHFVDEE